MTSEPANVAVFQWMAVMITFDDASFIPQKTMRSYRKLSLISMRGNPGKIMIIDLPTGYIPLPGGQLLFGLPSCILTMMIYVPR